MLIGYARVSTDDQSASLQLDALKEAGCERLYVDRASGSIRERPELARALADLRDGEDVLVVWRLDRVGRSLRHLVEIIGQLQERKVGFRSLRDPVDTTSASGRLVFHVFAALAEFERNLIQERTFAGLRAARARGRKGGRPSKLSPKEIKTIRALLKTAEIPVSEIAARFGIARSTLYRAILPGNAQ